MSAAFCFSTRAALARSSRPLRERQLGLLDPALLELVEAPIWRRISFWSAITRAADARTSTRVSSISRMIIRIIFAGSSALSRRSAKLAATISRVREKMLIQSLLYSFQGGTGRGSCRGRALPGRTASGESLTRKLRRDKSGRCRDQAVRQRRGRTGGDADAVVIVSKAAANGCQTCSVRSCSCTIISSSLCSPASQRHALSSTRAVPNGRKRRKPPISKLMRPQALILLAKPWENVPTLGNGAQYPTGRPILLLPRRGRAGEPRRAARPAGARHRRARHRQGADRRAPPPSVLALGRAAGRDELRRLARDPDRGGAVRPRGGRLHRRRPRRAPAASRRPTAAPCSSTSWRPCRRPAQDRLLRVVEYGEVTRIGASRPIQVDVRIVAATNEHLPRLAEQSRFRADLLDRLSLRGGHPAAAAPSAAATSRSSPIISPAGWRSSSNGTSWPGFSSAAMDKLLEYTWPGNVRELRNVVERAVYRWDGARAADRPTSSSIRSNRPGGRSARSRRAGRARRRRRSRPPPSRKRRSRSPPPTALGSG